MDEQTWLRSENWYELLEYLRLEHRIARTNRGKRRMRLWGCACCRRIPGMDKEPQLLQCLTDLERYADGELGDHARAGVAEVIQARQLQMQQQILQQMQQQIAQFAFSFHATVVSYLAWPTNLAMMCQAAVNHAAVIAQQDIIRLARLEGALNQESIARAGQAWHAARREHTEVFREIFGNPFSPHPKRRFPPEVRDVARTCAGGDLAAWPILGDALADLGEDAAADHCRQPDHVRGCHIVDWVLGRE